MGSAPIGGWGEGRRNGKLSFDSDNQGQSPFQEEHECWDGPSELHLEAIGLCKDQALEGCKIHAEGRALPSVGMNQEMA